MTEETIPMDRLAKVYVKIRDKISELTRDYETQVESSSKTEYGTVSLITKTRYYAQDWDAMKTFIKEHDAVDLLEKRIAQKNMQQFLEENPGVVPTGLNTVSEIEVSVRKPTK